MPLSLQMGVFASLSTRAEATAPSDHLSLKPSWQRRGPRLQLAQTSSAPDLS